MPLTADVVGVLREHRKVLLASGLYRADGFVFPTKNGGPIPHRSVQRWAFTQARDEAGLPAHVTLHGLRHAFASRAARRGVPVNVLSEILGHSHVGVTQKIYVHLYGRTRPKPRFVRPWTGKNEDEPPIASPLERALRGSFSLGGRNKTDHTH